MVSQCQYAWTMDEDSWMDMDIPSTNTTALARHMLRCRSAMARSLLAHSQLIMTILQDQTLCPYPCRLHLPTLEQGRHLPPAPLCQPFTLVDHCAYTLDPQLAPDLGLPRCKGGHCIAME